MFNQCAIPGAVNNTKQAASSEAIQLASSSNDLGMSCLTVPQRPAVIQVLQNDLTYYMMAGLAILPSSKSPPLSDRLQGNNPTF